MTCFSKFYKFNLNLLTLSKRYFFIVIFSIQITLLNYNKRIAFSLNDTRKKKLALWIFREIYNDYLGIIYTSTRTAKINPLGMKKITFSR